MAVDSLSWQTGPANSRLVRACLYLFEGSAGGVLLFLGYAGVTGDSVALVILGVTVLVAALVVWCFREEWESWWTRGMSESRLWREWLAVRRWWVTVAVAVFSGLGFVAIWTRYWWGHLPFSLLWFVAYSSLALASFLTVRGSVVPAGPSLEVVETGLLSARERERTYDLDALAGARRLSVGGWTFVLLSFATVPEGGGRRRLVRLPTAVARKAWPTFERAHRSKAELSQGARSERTVFRTGLALFLGMGLLLVAAAYWTGSTVVFAAFVALVVSGGFVAVLLAYELGFL